MEMAVDIFFLFVCRFCVLLERGDEKRSEEEKKKVEEGLFIFPLKSMSKNGLRSKWDKVG